MTRDGRDATGDWKQDKDFYYTDAISNNAVRYIKETPTDKPLFLYVAYTAAHWPLHAKPEDIAKYKGRYSKGWDVLREQRLARMKKLGVVRPDVKLSPRNPKVPAWRDEPNKAWQQRRMEVYAAQIDSMDQGIGRVISALKETGRLENTLLMLTVDNGGCHVEYGPARKGAFLNEKTRDGRPMVVGNRPDVMPGPEQTWQSYGYGWANASNTPLRQFKQFSHQGGVRVPMIVHWPKVIKEGGKTTDQLAHVIDLLPTALDAAGIAYPKTIKDRTISPADGRSMLPIFQGKIRAGHETLYFKFAQGRAIRHGKWKLVAAGRNPWELYDIDSDPTELNNLAAENPELVNKLSAMWTTWLKRSKK